MIKLTKPQAYLLARVVCKAPWYRMSSEERASVALERMGLITIKQEASWCLLKATKAGRVRVLGG